jgi:hypothetical protein
MVEAQPRKPRGNALYQQIISIDVDRLSLLLVRPQCPSSSLAGLYKWSAYLHRWLGTFTQDIHILLI